MEKQILLKVCIVAHSTQQHQTTLETDGNDNNFM